MKFEFGDLYKFLVSSGIALISLSLIVPWIFLKEPAGVTFSATDFENLEEGSRSLIQLRQNQISWTLKFMPFISGLFLILGIILCFSGLKKWRQLQNILDEKQRISLKVDQKNYQDMTAPEVEEKRQQEAFEDQQYAPSGSNSDTFLATYVNTEADVSSLISQSLGMHYTIFREQKIGKTYIDIVAQPKMGTNLTMETYSIEVKYRRAKPQYAEIKSGYLQSINAAQALGKVRSGPISSRLVVVYQDSVWDKEKFKELRSRLYDEFPEHANKHRILGLSSSDLQELSPNDFLVQMRL